MNMMGMIMLAVVSVGFFICAIIWCCYGIRHYQQSDVENQSWLVGFGRSGRFASSLQNIASQNQNRSPQISIQIQQHVQDNNIKIIEALPLFVLRQLPDGGVCVLAEQECPICQEPFQSGEILTYLGCGHVFHYTSIVPWLKKNNQCPVCRREVTYKNQNQEGYLPFEISSDASFVNCSTPFCYLPNPSTSTFPHISSVQSFQSTANK